MSPTETPLILIPSICQTTRRSLSQDDKTGFPHALSNRVRSEFHKHQTSGGGVQSKVPDLTAAIREHTVNFDILLQRLNYCE
jgi:hypothetical protein